MARLVRFGQHAYGASPERNAESSRAATWRSYRDVLWNLRLLVRLHRNPGTVKLCGSPGRAGGLPGWNYSFNASTLNAKV